MEGQGTDEGEGGRSGERHESGEGRATADQEEIDLSHIVEVLGYDLVGRTCCLLTVGAGFQDWQQEKELCAGKCPSQGGEWGEFESEEGGQRIVHKGPGGGRAAARGQKKKKKHDGGGRGAGSCRKLFSQIHAR